MGGVVAFVTTPYTSRLARRFGILDHPGEGPESHKRHLFATPYLGGVAIFMGTSLGSVFLLSTTARAPDGRITVYLAAVAIAVALGLVGLLDDIRPLPRTVRLAAQVAAAGAAWQVGFRVSATPWTWLNVAIMVIWVVGITNAFNLMDNMDGLSAGLAGVAACAFAAMGVLEELPPLAIVSAALGGAALGFLAHNRHPARAFMGDAGSLFIGFLLALIGIKLQFENLVKVTFLVPVIVLGLPIFDTTLVVLSRVSHGRPAFLGGRDHVSHRLVRIGLPVKTAVGFLYFSGLCLGWLGLVISRSTVQVGFMLLGLVMALALFFGILLWAVPVYKDESEAIEALEETQHEDQVTYLEDADARPS